MASMQKMLNINASVQKVFKHLTDSTCLPRLRSLVTGALIALLGPRLGSRA